MFLKDDIYTSSGTLKLYHCWTDKVTKFDSSSFYNWEQDNLPIYDLDERTAYLWEQLGFPTSSIPGIALVVSADAPDSAVACNKNVFKTVSAAIQALPQSINFPVLIEVASFGSLGDLVLNNYRFGPRGSLEIINRNFATADALASGSILGVDYSEVLVTSGSSDGIAQNTFNYLSSVAVDPLILGVFPAVSRLLSPKGQMLDASCLSISSVVFSSTTDARFTNSNLNGYVSPYHGNSNFCRGSLILGDQNTVSPGTGTSSIAFKTYDLNPYSYDSISTYDVSTTDLFTGNKLYLNNYTNNIRTRGLFYNNKLSKIVINNCEGPIFIRGFFLDGSGNNATTNLNGVEINNCPNVNLENIVAFHYRNAGFLFNNSNVKLLRGCVANRIYGYKSSTRLTGLWDTRSKYSTFNSTNKTIAEDLAAGLIANNSIVTVSSTSAMEAPLQSAAILAAGGGSVKYNPYMNLNYIFDFSKNANGIILNNSILTGGDTPHMSLSYFYLLNLDIYNNVGYGLKATNSTISLNGRINIFENLYGAKLDSSVFEIDKITAIYNQKTALEVTNSNVKYHKNLEPYADNALESFKDLHFSANGQHLVLDNSKITPVFTSGMDALYRSTILQAAFGKLDSISDNKLLPAVDVRNNSEAILIAPLMTRDATHSVGSYTSCKGSEISVTNNSKVTLKGTKNFATRVFGPVGRGYQSKMAALYAGKDSTLEINGPTVIAQYGIDILADGRSEININPHKSKADGSIDVSSFNLADSANHTAVELHSTRACIVVDDHSTLNVKDLGSYKQHWTRSGNYTAIAASGLDYENTNAAYYDNYVSAGSLQFYPNPIPSGTGSTYSPYAGKDDLGSTITSPANAFTQASNKSLYYLKDWTTETVGFNFSSLTAGGYCVRALNNSFVNVHNVNFPCGWWQTSAPYYDNTVGTDSGGYCYKTFIWNIADDSQIKASYVSVSSAYPRAAGYYGPSGSWGGSGMPSSTPDTSSLSILDYFGSYSTNPYGKSTAQNYGPFRLYFSVNPATYAMTYSGTLNTSSFGIIPQIFSQGYQPSGALICNPDVSAIYSIALQRNSSNVIAASGYYYGSAMMGNDGHIRAFLDESAAETFANAKHCSVGKSGNAKLVSIHYPYTTAYGSSNAVRGIKSVNLFDIERDN